MLGVLALILLQVSLAQNQEESIDNDDTIYLADLLSYGVDVFADDNGADLSVDFAEKINDDLLEADEVGQEFVEEDEDLMANDEDYEEEETEEYYEPDREYDVDEEETEDEDDYADDEHYLSLSDELKTVGAMVDLQTPLDNVEAESSDVYQTFTGTEVDGTEDADEKEFKEDLRQIDELDAENVEGEDWNVEDIDLTESGIEGEDDEGFEDFDGEYLPLDEELFSDPEMFLMGEDSEDIVPSGFLLDEEEDEESFDEDFKSPIDLGDALSLEMIEDVEDMAEHYVSTRSVDGGAMCKTCVSFASQALSQLINIILRKKLFLLI